MDLAQEQPSSRDTNPLLLDRDTNPFLLEAGVRRELMCPCLYNAAISGNVEDVQKLLEDTKECVYHVPCGHSGVTTKRNTVLHIAAGLGHMSLANAMCRKDTSLLVSENARSETPLLCAAKGGHRDMVSLIIRLAQESGLEVLRKKNNAGDTALHEAARHSHDEVLKVLVTADPVLASEVNQAGMSPLYLAVMDNSKSAVQALIQCNNASFAGPNGKTALHAAVFQSEEITSMLLNWDPKLARERDASNSTPLHYAASDSDVNIVRKLLDSDPSTVYSQDEHGWTPLHVAARMGHADVIALLIKTCPDSVEIHDKQGRNFLHSGVEKKQPSVAKFFRRHSNLAKLANLVKIPCLLKLANEHDNLVKLANLVKIPCLLKLANEHDNLVKLANEQDNQGNTPLHLAVINQDSRTVSELSKVKGIKSRIMNNEGRTPLDLIDKSTSSFHATRALLELSLSGSRFSPQRQDHLKQWRAEDQPKDKTSKNLIVVAVLLATVAFSVTFNVPGGYDDKNGEAKVRNSLRYKVFMMADTIALASSVFATILLVAERALRRAAYEIHAFIGAGVCVWISLVSLNIAFTASALIALGKICTLSYFVGAVPALATILLMAVLYKGCPTRISATMDFGFWTLRTENQHVRRRIQREYKTLLPLVMGTVLFLLVNVVVCVVVPVILLIYYNKTHKS